MNQNSSSARWRSLSVTMLLAMAVLTACSSVHLSEEELRKPYYENRHAVAGCYQQAITDHPMLKGDVEFRVVISHKGQVLSVRPRPLKSSIKHEEMTKCLQTEIQSWEFPPKKRTTVVYPFVFEQSSEISQ